MSFVPRFCAASHGLSIRVSALGGRTPNHGSLHVLILLPSGRSPPLDHIYSLPATSSIRAQTDLLISSQKLEQARGHRASPNPSASNEPGSAASAPDLLSFAVFRSGACQRINCCTEDGTAGSSFRSPAIRILACPLDRTASFRSSSLLWPFIRRARPSGSGLRPRCWRASACIPEARSIAGWWRRFRADLRRHDLLRDRQLQRQSSDGSTMPLQFHERGADLVWPLS